MKKPPSLETIAKMAGISKMSASVALSGKKGVSELTRRRVREIAEKLGYKTNPLVSSLMNQVQKSRSKLSCPTVALVVLRPRNWKFREEVVNGIQSKAVVLGYQVREFFMGENGMTPERTADILQKEGVEGIIVGDGVGSSMRLPMYLHGFVTVMMGYSIVRPDMHRVCADHAKNIEMAIGGLLSIGYKKIGLFIDQESNDRSRKLYTAIFTQIMESSIPPDRRIPFGLGQTWANPKPFKEWFLKYKPDAVITLGNATKTWLEEMNYSVPNDVGLANLALRPDLDWSGINQNFSLMAGSSMELLDILFRTNQRTIPTYPLNTLVPGFWVSGTTTSRRK